MQPPMALTSGFSNDESELQCTNKTAAGARYKQTFMSYFGQANYSYKNKYFCHYQHPTRWILTFWGKCCH